VVGKAAAYEINRMIAAYEAGRADELVQETRGGMNKNRQPFSA
jgi:hypothetical protein